MNKLGILLFLTFGLTSMNAVAETIYTVNRAKIVQHAKVFKDVTDQLRTQNKRYQKEISSLREEAWNMAEKFKADRKKLTPGEVTDRQQVLQKKTEHLHKLGVTCQHTLANEEIMARDKIWSEISKVLSNLAKSRKISKIYLSDQFAYLEGHVDLTQDVVNELDKKLPKLQLTFKSRRTE